MPRFYRTKAEFASRKIRIGDLLQIMGKIFPRKKEKTWLTGSFPANIFVLFLLVFSGALHAQSKNLNYQWTKISGPDEFKIVSPNSAVTSVTDLVVGVYQFELKVTNSSGISARDTMKLTVKPPSYNLADNQPRTRFSTAILGKQRRG